MSVLTMGSTAANLGESELLKKSGHLAWLENGI